MSMVITYATANPDTFIGGPDEIAVSYQNAPGPVGIYLTDGGSPYGWAFGDTYKDIHVVYGSAFGDYISGNGQNDTLYGGAGDDAIYAFGSAGSVSHLYGEAGHDTLIGGAGTDIMDGGSGENTISYLLSPTGLTISLADTTKNTGWAATDTYISIQDVIGSNFNDVIYGSNEGLLNQLQSQSGDDTIFGGSGYNVLIGGAGADALHGAGTGNLIDYETAGSGLTASMADPSRNTGDAAGDTYINLKGADLAGSPYNDILYGDDGNNNLIGDPDFDTYGRFGNDTMYGGAGNDTFDGRGGADHFDGGEGFDVAVYASSRSGIVASMLNPGSNTGDAAGDTYVSIEGVMGSNFDDQLSGNNADNSLFGGLGNDQLYGNDGNDTLEGGGGADRLDGGAGFDTASYGDSTVGLTVSLADPSKNTGVAAGDTYVSIEAILGSAHNDIFYGDANSNVIQAGAGDDILYGGGGSDLLYGNDGNDTLIAQGPGTTGLIGGAGADTFKFLSVTDSISTPLIAPSVIADFETGIDRIDVSAISPTSVHITPPGADGNFYTIEAVAAGGTLTVRSNQYVQMSDIVTVVPGQSLTGGPGYDQLIGGGGADRITGGGSGDNLTGGAGPDTFAYTAPSDSVLSNYDIITDFQTGVDKIDLSALQPTYISLIHTTDATYLFPSTPGGEMAIAASGDVEGSDLLTGHATNLYIVGSDNGDNLIGGSANDTIVGNGGNDVITGGGSGDALFGNGGTNTFRYTSSADSNSGGYDIIHDFKTGTDMIDISALNANNVSLVSIDTGTFLFGIGNDGVVEIGSTATINGNDIKGLTGGVYMSGNDLNNTLIGSSFGDTIVGGGGSDVIIGGGGADSLSGGSGADVFKYSSATESGPDSFDIIHDFQTGVDTLDLTALNPSNVSLIRYDGGTFIFGASPTGYFEVGSTQDINASDIVGLTAGAFSRGDDANNILQGANFAETLNGGGGNDIIIGGGGSDSLFGGAGADTFKYLAVSDSTPSSYDIIQDFQPGIDRLDLTAVRTGAADNYALISDSTTSYLFVDLGGNGTNDMQILFNHATVHASDILF
ncbi:M10 family metallopeptidase C-terminal domain-containing protein [uncultured Methylobacterium sp.]|uniref:M10 family metallopeptidase C-terminal domain-containing protein n=1 Tax=uncultured Methylobacterium sp. TaxID=157278 RepID=UPI0035CC2A16